MLLTLSSTTTWAQCDENNIKVPETFTVASDDSDKGLVIETKAIKDVHVTIFDRWGKKVFKSSVSVMQASDTDFKAVDTGWDAKKQGEDLMEGWYVYSIEGTCKNNKFARKGGNIELIRKTVTK